MLFNPELRSANFLVPGLIVLILIMTAVMSTALSIVREKERGTMEQLIVSPIRPLELVVGKTVPYFLIGLVAAGAILAASRLLFGVTVKGSWLDLGGGDSGVPARVPWFRRAALHALGQPAGGVPPLGLPHAPAGVHPVGLRLPVPQHAADHPGGQLRPARAGTTSPRCGPSW